MYLQLNGHPFHYEMENICRLFLPQEPITVSDAPPAERSGVFAQAFLYEGDTACRILCRVVLDESDQTLEDTVPHTAKDYDTACELRMAKLLYRLFSDLFSVTPPWGIITGVRPVKMLRRSVRTDGTDEARRHFTEDLLCSPQKLALAEKTLTYENKILELSKNDSFSLYISIPFCPTRCDYCSFVSHTTAASQKLIPEYVTLLQKELQTTGEIVRALGLRPETVYMGGGTPTTLTAGQMEAVLKTVSDSFDLSAVREFTVEAGRPDTVTEEKLRAIKAGGAGRVSINPQTLSDSVLEAIGRRHTAAQFYEAFDMARRIGFDAINTDLIAGLPTDTPDGFCETMAGILALRPENVTVHTLSMKRASNLVVSRRADYDGGQDAAEMVAYAAQALPDAGYHPYYLYRQSRCVGNQENVGWSLDGFDGLYNVYIMDETHTILGCGAGAVSKLKQPGGDYLTRIFNYKFPYEYNRGIDEMQKRKEQVVSFYEQFGG